MANYQVTGPSDVANRAIVLMGGFNSNEPLTGTPATNFDNTPLGKAAAVAYGGVVQTVGKMFGWDFARNYAPLALSGGTAPPWWTFEYLYPTNGIEIRQVSPLVIPDQNNPSPTRWTVATNTIAGIQRKVIWTNVAVAVATISGVPIESSWDAGFTEEVIRLLASELAMGAAGRPETGQLELDRSANIGGVARTRPG
jgi:hypothetical protein